MSSFLVATLGVFLVRDNMLSGASMDPSCGRGIFPASKRPFARTRNERTGVDAVRKLKVSAGGATVLTDEYEGLTRWRAGFSPSRRGNRAAGSPAGGPIASTPAQAGDSRSTGSYRAAWGGPEAGFGAEDAEDLVQEGHLPRACFAAVSRYFGKKRGRPLGATLASSTLRNHVPDTKAKRGSESRRLPDRGPLPDQTRSR